MTEIESLALRIKEQIELGNYQKKEIVNEITYFVFDFVNHYIKINKIDKKFEIENKTLIEDFINKTT